ncbi:ras guanine nucleotide exchange factor domain-containing protein [Pilobolus umbonatus]|nr:ras guanine nucleotide exchange factor domain-containing protein [Pilobolus umbonatus]
MDAIQLLSNAAKNGESALYYTYSAEIVNSIRFMLVASSTLDKESDYIKLNSTLRAHHRAMMASMSKLVLTAQTCYTLDNTNIADDTISKILTESHELLVMVRNFMGSCQDLGVPFHHTDPMWLDTTPSEKHVSPRESHLVKTRSHRDSLQINLVSNLETMGMGIQDSAEIIIKCISSHLMVLLEKPDEKPDRTALSTLLFTHLRNLSSQTSSFLYYLDDSDFGNVSMEEEVVQLKIGKQQLCDALGLFFYRLQLLTDESVDLENVLMETEVAAGRVHEPVDLICSNVTILVNKMKDLVLKGVLADEASDLSKKGDEEVSDDHSAAGTQLSKEDNPFDESAAWDEEDTERIKRSSSLERHRSQSSSIMTSGLPPLQRTQTTPPKANKLTKFFGDDIPLNAGTAKPTANEVPSFLQYDYSPNEIVFNMEGNVKGGTLPALVERLTLHDYLDMSFINTFLLTYRSFCTSTELLDLLEARYNLQCPPNLTEEEAAVWEEKKLKLVRLRVFNILKNWLETYYNEDESIILDRILDFTRNHINVTLKFSNGQLESLIQRRREMAADSTGFALTGGVLKKMIPTSGPLPEPILPRSRKGFKLLDVDPLEMARQLTIMDFKLYSAIRPIECLDKDWSAPEDQTGSNIRASIDYCNQVTAWVSDNILSQHDIKKRSILIKYWVQVAERCRILNNFNTCMAILSAFDNSSVGRLKRTWEVVGARTSQTLQHIRKMMGANKNFTEYRAIIHSINPPCIPFLGIYLQDLTFIEDGNPNALKKWKDLINFAKRAKKAEVIREIQQYQSSSYRLKPVDELQEFIKSNLKSTRDEEQLYKESLKLEPREREDEKITRLLQESGFL